MSALRLALGELRRITAGRLPKIAVLALAVIPLLYGGLYLYANHDPYANLSHVPAAVVVEDTGATTAQGSPLRAGEQVADDLVKSGSFEWHRTDAADAESGVRTGRYDFAVTLPADFSSALASSGRFAPRQGALVLTTNDANNYIARTIADRVTDQVRDSLARQVGEQAATTFLAGFATIREQLGSAVTGAGQLVTGAQQAKSGADQLAGGAGRLVAGQRRLLTGATQLESGAQQASSGARRLAAGSGRLASGLGQLRTATAQLPAQTAQLASGARQVAAGNARIAAVGDRVAAASGRLAGSLDTYRARLDAELRAQGVPAAERARILALTDRLRAPVTDANRQVQTTATQLDRLSSGASQVAAGAGRLAAAAPRLSSGIATAATGAQQLDVGAQQLAAGTGQLATGAGQLRAGEASAVQGADQLASGATRLDQGLSQLASGADRLRGGLQQGLSQVPNPDAATRSATARTIADPVTIRNIAQTTAGSYGAGLAPFFVSLAAWIGGYVLFLLVRPLSDRAMAANQTPLRVALGGWLAPAVLGAVQVLFLIALIAFGLRIVPAHYVLTPLFLVLVSVTFVAIVQALNAWLGTAGQFLALVLMLVQLVSAGGTFP
ncbi:MAG TPA: YhgE/Pip family protein, partial [Kineosporiaceae bacterium]|nr:YhgE/Pip family protein [Kineosporiaceae bacterium]